MIVLFMLLKILNANPEIISQDLPVLGDIEELIDIYSNNQIDTNDNENLLSLMNSEIYNISENPLSINNNFENISIKKENDISSGNDSDSDNESLTLAEYIRIKKKFKNRKSGEENKCENQEIINLAQIIDKIIEKGIKSSCSSESSNSLTLAEYIKKNKKF